MEIYSKMMQKEMHTEAMGLWKIQYSSQRLKWGCLTVKLQAMLANLRYLFE
jgi:hypothetical protein